MSEREIEVYSYTLNIQSVKIKVKFPCKMKLQYAGEVITSEVSQNESGKFIFNQQVTLKEDMDRANFEILAHLVSEKGGKYLAGVIRLVQSELTQQEGQMIVVNLLKCFSDPEACCQLRVDQVTTHKLTRKIPIQQVMLAKKKEMVKGFSPKQKQDLSGPKNNHGTKSQFNFPINKNRLQLPQKNREEGFLSIHEKSRSPINNFRKIGGIANTHIEKNIPEFGIYDSANRDKLIQAQVYKESYHKLKEKYKKQAETVKQELNRRIALENNENNYKLQIMRLKLRCEEQQKTISEKNIKIKQMQLSLASLQKKELDLSYLRQETANKDHTIKMLQDTIRTLNKDNQDLKSLNKERFEAEQQKIRDLRSQVDQNKLKYESRINDLQRELKQKMESLLQKDSQLRIRQQRIHRQQKLVQQLQKTHQTKILENERNVQILQSQWKSKQQDLKHIIDKLQRQKQKLEQDLDNSKEEQQKAKSLIIKVEYDKKILNQEAQSLKQEVTDGRTLKQKHQELLKEHRILVQDKNNLQKQFEKTVQNKDSNIEDLNKQFKQQVEYYRKIYKDVEEKLRNIQAKNLQLESLFELKKNECEKLKKNNQLINKENNDLKERQKNFKKSLKSKEDELLGLHTELESSKYKTKSGDQISRYQIENLREDLSKTKRDLDIQILKSGQLQQKVNSINNELSKSKFQWQQAVDLHEKDSTTYKDKISFLENVNRDYEKKCQQFQNTITNLRTIEKDSQSKIQKIELQIIKLNQKVDKHLKQIRILEEKVNQLENSNKSKQAEINQLQGAKDSLQKKIIDQEDKMGAVKHSLNTITGEKNKNEKIIQLLNRQIADYKAEIDKFTKLVQSKQKSQEDLRGEIKKAKQQFLKLEMKNNGLKKEYQRFKDHLHQTLNNLYSQIPLGDMKASGVSLFQVAGKRSDNLDSSTSMFNTDLLNKVTSQYKEIKVSFAKLIDQNKLLQKEVERISMQSTGNQLKNEKVEENLNKRINQLEEQIEKVILEKQQEAIKNRGIRNEIQKELQIANMTIEELKLQIQETDFTISSLKMDQQASKSHFDIKTNQYKSKINDLEDSIVELKNNISILQESKKNVQIQLSEKVSQLQQQEENGVKRDKEIQELKQQRRILNLTVEENKKLRKELLEKISQLQLKLSTQIEMKEKNRVLLDDEQRKATELKEFVATLMKQKQVAIKGDLEKSQQIIKLEANLIQMTRERDSYEQEAERLKKSMQELKESNRKLNGHIKQLQSLGTDEKGKSSKLNERLREKQRQLRESEQSLSRVKSEYEKLNHKTSKSISELSREIQDSNKQKEKERKKLNEKINEIEQLKQQAEAKIIVLNSQILVLEENLFMEKQSGEVKLEESSRLTEQLTKYKAHIKMLEQTIDSLNEELKEKDESTYDLSGRIYLLENKIEVQENQFNEKKAEILDEWTQKYQNVVDEYEQRITLVEKQNGYYKARLEQKQQEHRKLVAQCRNNELEDTGLKKALQEKIKRLEEQRLSVISSKNSEIQRLAQQSKSKFEALKTKEADLRRLQHQLEVARTTINKLEQSKRQTEQKIKLINKGYQSELEQLKKREAVTRNSQQKLQRIQWDIQRQVKKAVQSFYKKINQSSPEENQKISQSIKGIQQQILSAISVKLSPGTSASN